MFSFRNLLFQVFVCAANRLRGRAFYSVEPGPSEGSRGAWPSVHSYGARVLLVLLCTAPPGRAAAETGGCPGYAGRSVGAELPGSLVLDPMTTYMPFGAMGRSCVLGPSRCRSPAFLWALKWRVWSWRVIGFYLFGELAAFIWSWVYGDPVGAAGWCIGAPSAIKPGQMTAKTRT